MQEKNSQTFEIASANVRVNIEIIKSNPGPDFTKIIHSLSINSLKYKHSGLKFQLKNGLKTISGLKFLVLRQLVDFRFCVKYLPAFLLLFLFSYFLLILFCRVNRSVNKKKRIFSWTVLQHSGKSLDVIFCRTTSCSPRGFELI